jgi:hypothetical protein
MQHKAAYFMGFGLFPSVLCNILFSGVMSNGMFFLLSPLLIFNALITEPPSSTEVD